jgi:hypothetical protein
MYTSRHIHFYMVANRKRAARSGGRAVRPQCEITGGNDRIEPLTQCNTLGSERIAKPWNW